jgi:hypothetical protein
MIRQALTTCALLALIAFGVNATSKEIPSPKLGLDKKANESLFRASEFLKQAKTFQFKATIMRDVMLDDDIQVQFGGISNVTVQSPNKLRAIFRGDERSRETYFDGNTLTIYSLTKKIYMQEKVPGTIGNAVDFVFEKFGFSVPLSDLVYPDPYAVLIENIEKGFFLGQHKVGEILCDHLAFKQATIDWQIWIEIGDKPFVRKILITYKTEEGYPKYVALLSNWKINPTVKDSDFTFTPPADVEKIEFLTLDRIYGVDEDVEEIETTGTNTEDPK